MKELRSEYSSLPERSIVGKEDKKRSEYFQSIARYFFKQRGAPFFLSSKELDCVAQWEKTEIPLSVVLEGIKRSFENYRGKPGKRTKIQSLVFCNFQVLKTFEQYRERKVGHKEWIGDRDEKWRRVKAEVNGFLKTIPPPVSYLKETYSRAQKILTQSHFNEEKLERIEGEIEELLWKNAPDEEKASTKRDILREYGFKEEEFERIFRIKLVKNLRDKYKIPYISLFYY